jgi:hypothetical protein
VAVAAVVVIPLELGMEEMAATAGAATEVMQAETTAEPTELLIEAAEVEQVAGELVLRELEVLAAPEWLFLNIQMLIQLMLEQA